MTDDELATLRTRIKRIMFEMNMPTGSDQLGVPLHVCDPDLCCRICKTHAIPHRNCILR